MTNTPETREFHVGDILSVLTGVLVSTRHVDGLYDLLGFMVGEPVWTHQLPRAARECEPALRKQFPDLATITVPDGIHTEEKLLAWLAPLEQQYGATHTVTRLAAEDHTSIDPVTEMRMHHPDKLIVPIVDDGPES